VGRKRSSGLAKQSGIKNLHLICLLFLSILSIFSVGFAIFYVAIEIDPFSYITDSNFIMLINTVVTYTDPETQKPSIMKDNKLKSGVYC
jgi:hypothetical protein